MSNHYLTPVFLDTPQALAWTKHPDWPHMLLVGSSKDAQAFILGIRKEIVPIWLVEMRCAFKTHLEFYRNCFVARSFINIEPHDPPEAWDSGKWEIGFEAYVGGDRRLEFPDEAKLKRLVI